MTCTAVISLGRSMVSMFREYSFMMENTECSCSLTENVATRSKCIELGISRTRNAQDLKSIRVSDIGMFTSNVSSAPKHISPHS